MAAGLGPVNPKLSIGALLSVLVPGALDTLSGTIRYHAAFDSL